MKIANLHILSLREPGIYGIVNVPYRVITVNGSEIVDDITPTEGYVTFRDKQVR